MKKSQNKIYLSLAMLSTAQKKDLKAFMELPSNKLSTQEKTVLGQLLNIDVKNEKKVATVWKEALADEAKASWNTIKNRMQNKLLSTIDRYLLLVTIEEDPPFAYLRLGGKYLENGVNKNGAFWLKKALEIIDQDAGRSLQNELIRFWIAEYQVNTLKVKKAKDRHIEIMEKALRSFYELNSLRLYCEKLNRQKITSIDHGADDEYEQWEIKNTLKEGQLYYQLVKLLKYKDRAAYFYIYDFVKEHKYYFEKKYLKEFIEYLMNFCIRRVNEHEDAYAAHYLEFIDLLESENILLERNGLSLYRFINAMAAGIIAKNLEWVEKFVSTYKHHIGMGKKINKSAFLKFYDGLLALYLGDLTRSWELFRNFQSSDMYRKEISYRITCDKSLLKIYYQQNDLDVVKQQLRGIFRYIDKHKKVSKVAKVYHFCFLEKLEQLVDGKPIELEADKKKLQLLDYNWLKKMQYNKVPL